MRFMTVAWMASAMTLNHGLAAQTIATRGKWPGLRYSPITEIHISKEDAMDEYLFLTLARLKADRLVLGRAERGPKVDPEQLPLALVEPAAIRRPRRPPVRKAFAGHRFFVALPKESIIMRSALILAAAVAIHLSAFAALQWDLARAQLPPAGEVTITQLEESASLALAQLDEPARQAATRRL
jgi:hypothetical protein